MKRVPQSFLLSYALTDLVYYTKYMEVYVLNLTKCGKVQVVGKQSSFWEMSAFGSGSASVLIFLPERAQIWCVENGCSDSGAVYRWVGVNRPDQDLELGLDSLGLFCVFAHNSEASHTFTCGNRENRVRQSQGSMNYQRKTLCLELL